ncbi:MAG: amidase family protein [Gemmatimonadales bacterium]
MSSTTMLRCIAVTIMVLAGSTQMRAQERTFDLLTASVADIQQAVAAGALTYERLVQLYLNRIEAYDKSGPKLNAVLQIHSRALEIARELDEERRISGLRSPLHGIPIIAKDVVDVKDIPSAGGNLALAGTYPAHDATVIRKLRAAGAIIFLKGNLDEFNLGSQGLSSLGGQVLNPYDLSRNPGGSSAGPGVAVNVGFATLGIATETGASIRSPASNNSIVGIAPSQGLVSRTGVIAISYTQDRIGVHAKSVADAATMLTYMRGFDAEDLFTWESLGKLDPRPYTDFLDSTALSGARIGVFRDLFRRGEEFQEINGLIEQEIDFVRRQGAVVIDGLTTGMDLVAFFPQARASVFEFKYVFDAYLKNRGPDTPVHSLEELMATGKYLKALDRFFRLALSVDSPDFDPVYLSRLENRLTVRKLIVDLMDKHHLDALVHPFKSLAAPPLGTGDRGPRDNPISAITGLPAIVMPAGVNSQGLPIAIEFLGRPFSEPTLIQLAYAYEQASHKRVAPQLTPHLPGEIIKY